MVDYELLRSASGVIGLLTFVIVFTGIVIWAYRPGAQKEMDDNANIPFREEEPSNG